ncbi:type II secretion system secretin GspD [Parapusillimonas granuli]|uniref:Type II secretion system secretin GspD n=1 Tax=Parapusillimonas granuli TaxID=380911 RepID=A0A853G6L8_9BURK|nr:type II secretion system secretin GspD [Parapusillimonas granuli]MBB5214199.1 general secretion pathway protein D [Parapusillimonas granuli]MEB2399026.1 type II secretion system secretin GspD [Alcaligenaceae bacterium]NYT50620.1 type II secretion system secretin GspD [Parapusillimonas granuli]
MNKLRTTVNHRHRLRPALPALTLCLAVAGCAAPAGPNADGGGSQLVVHTSTGQGWRQEGPGGTAAPVRETTPRARPIPRRADDRDGPARDSADSRKAAGGATMLNFVEADLQGVLRALARFTGRNFVVDPRVRGQLTLVSEAPVDPDTAYSMLLGALRMQGYAVVDVDGVSRVVPEADAKLQGTPVRSGGASAGAHGGELITRVFQLRYENAANLVPILRPMIAPNNTINAYAGNNTLVITDYADNLDRIAEVIAGIDTPDSTSTDVVPIRYGVALDVAALAAQLLDGRAGGDATQHTVVVADPRSNSVLLRASSPDRLQLARDLIRRIDNPESRAGNLHVVYLRNAQATRLAEVLRGALGGSQGGSQASDGGGAALGQDGLNLAGATSGGALAGGMPGSAATTSTASSAGASRRTPTGGASATLGGSDRGSMRTVSFSAGGATIQADPSTNTLIISAPDPLYRSLREVIDQLDQRRAQVLVESLIVEVSAENAAEFGIQWMLGGNDISGGGSSFIGGANLAGTGINFDGKTTIDALGQGLSLGVVKGTVNILGNQVINLGVLARALQSTSGANVLSTPNLMTLDNEEASIVVGRTMPFVTGRYTTSGDGASNPFQTITREDVGLTLRIRPQISEGGTVKLALYQEVSTVDNALSTKETGTVTRKRAMETNVLVDDGQIIVLGGLLEDVISDGTRSVPLLGDIPVVGNLFRYDRRSHSKTNLMVFLRPHIVRNARDGASVTLDRYNYMRTAQSQLPARSTWFSPESGLPPLPAFERNPSSGLLDLRDPADAQPLPDPAPPGSGKAPPKPAKPGPSERL